MLAAVSLALIAVTGWGLIRAIERGDDAEAHAVATTAEVGRVTRNVNRQTNWAVVRYSVNGGERAHEIMIKGSDPEPGDLMMVLYDARDPDQVWDELTDPPAAQPPAWVILSFTGGVASGAGAVASARARRVDRDG